MNNHTAKGCRVLATIVLSAMLVVSIPSAASAENRCGTPAAGKFKNAYNSNHDVRVKGDHVSGTVRTVIVRPNQTAASRGICDADFFYPTSKWMRFITVGVYEYYRAFEGRKIGASYKQCSASGKSSHPLICT